MSSSVKPIRVLVAGLGNMGRSHALAYHNNPGFEIVGLVNRSKPHLAEELQGYTIHPDFEAALKESRASVTPEIEREYEQMAARLKQDATGATPLGFIAPGQLRPHGPKGTD